MRLHAIKGALLAFIGLHVASAAPENYISTVLGGLESVASGATNLISTAIMRPREILIDATRATTGYIDSAAARGIENKLIKFLEKFRSLMPNGLAQLGLPPLEPYHLDEINMDISNPEIGNISAIIEDLNIYNLSTFEVDRARLSLAGPTITANLTIPVVHVEGIYNISGIFGFFLPIHDTGTFKANISDFKLYVNAVLGYSRGFYLRKLDLDVSLDSVDPQVKSIQEDETLAPIINKMLKELSPETLSIIKPDILPIIEDYVASQINDTLRQLSLRNLFKRLLDPSEIQDITNFIIP